MIAFWFVLNYITVHGDLDEIQTHESIPSYQKHYVDISVVSFLFTL